MWSTLYFGEGEERRMRMRNGSLLFIFSTSVEVGEESDGRQEGDVLRNQFTRGYFYWKAK